MINDDFKVTDESLKSYTGTQRNLFGPTHAKKNNTG